MRINIYAFLFYIFLIALLILELFTKNDSEHHFFDGSFAFYAIVGFFSSFLFVLISKVLRKFLLRDKKFYE